MRGRALRILLLVFEALWLNVMVPGHQRGVVPLPGEKRAVCEAQATDSCDCPTAQPSAPPKEKGRGDPAKRCAICYFAARLCTPPVIDLTLPPLRLIELLPFPAPDARESDQFVPTYYGRGPPPAHANLT